MSNADILVIDDEIQIRRLLEITLHSNDFNFSAAATGAEGLIAAANHPPDLIILNIGLPDLSGHEVLKKLREWYSKPMLTLSEINNEQDIVSALDKGANDYLAKPFTTAELLARIRSAPRGSLQEESNPVIIAGDLTIDLSARIIKKGGQIIKLTGTEYVLLSLFAKNEGKVLTHQYLLREIWGPGFIRQSQYLRVFIAQLRKKIETDSNRPCYIITEAGVGCRFKNYEL